MGKRICFLAGVLVLVSGACLKMKHEMVIQPVHITVDVRIRIDRALDDFFGDIDKAALPAPSDNAGQQEEVK